MKGVTIRRMTEADVKAVSRIEAETFSDPWSEQGFLDSLGFDNVIFLVAELDGDVLGYCGMYCALDESEITNIAVKEEIRNQGIGEKLLDSLLAEAKAAAIITIVLEVRTSNMAAISLYERLGFQTRALRPNFYQNPKEDAFLMIMETSNSH